MMSWAENAESVMEHILNLQKFLPNFQDMITTADGAKTHPTKGSQCNDIVSFLSGVDDESFDRALKLLRGYGSLPEPPVPPNSAYGGGRSGKQGQDNGLAEGLLYSPIEPNSRQHFGTFPKTAKGDTFSMQRKSERLNVLPPIEKPLGGNLLREPASLAEERLLQAAHKRQTMHGATTGNLQRNSVLFNEHSISGADILSTMPPERRVKLRHSSGDHEDNTGYDRNFRLTTMHNGQFVDSRLRHSVSGDVPRLRNSSLPKHSKPDLFKSRKTTR
ncbi:uncharacterized protein LOC135462181 [Liolophura sinensis]|uniref:uncharacterized protein LOC135462181 n=1 Tax=Liolophura sinensis TaxID=3198878 RepID=UPI00315926E8